MFGCFIQYLQPCTGLDHKPYGFLQLKKSWKKRFLNPHTYVCVVLTHLNVWDSVGGLPVIFVKQPWLHQWGKFNIHIVFLFQKKWFVLCFRSLLSLYSLAQCNAVFYETFLVMHAYQFCCLKKKIYYSLKKYIYLFIIIVPFILSLR